MARPTMKRLPWMAALLLCVGCVTGPATLRPADLEVCAVTHGDPFRFVICAERGRPRILGHDYVTPNLYLRLDTRNANMGDLRDWRLTVIRDGVVIRDGPAPPAPLGSWSAVGARVDTFVRLPGARWIPGLYQVKLVWTLDPFKHVEADFVVPRATSRKRAAVPVP